MKVLFLTLHKKWFDMILSGEKKEEYREVKDYWTNRLKDKDFDVICFRNGYSKGSREMIVELDKKCVGFGNPEWGAPADKCVWILKLGEIKETRNIDLTP